MLKEIRIEPGEHGLVYILQYSDEETVTLHCISDVLSYLEENEKQYAKS